MQRCVFKSVQQAVDLVFQCFLLALQVRYLPLKPVPPLLARPGAQLFNLLLTVLNSSRVSSSQAVQFFLGLFLAAQPLKQFVQNLVGGAGSGQLR